MKSSRRIANRASAGWLLLGVVVSCLLLYGVAKSVFDSSDEDLGQRQQSAAGVSSRHSPFSLPASSRSPRIDQQIEKLKPSGAEWESEQVSDSINKQLKRLSRRLEARGNADYSEFSAATFDGEILSANALQTVFDDGKCRTQRLRGERSDVEPTESLHAQFNSFVGDGAGDLRCAFKVTQIQIQQSVATTGLLFQLVRQDDAAVEQLNAVFRCQWQLDAVAPKLRSLSIEQFDRIVLSAEGRRLFDDVTESTLGNGSEADREVFEEQVLRDVGYWCERLSTIDDMNIYGHHGLAIADVNRDGFEDIYVCDSGGLPNRLYLQRPDGTLQDASQESKVDWLESTSSALLIDLDNDGDPDLVAATVAGLIVASNNGAGVFRIRAAYPNIPEAQSLCAADYDNDGDLDFYVTVYGSGGSAERQRGFEGSAPIPYHDANNGGANLMYENQGGFRFVDITQRCGLDSNNRRFSFAAGWEDFDTDGDVDLYVANDFGRNNLYLNDGGTFRDVAADLSVEDMAGGMSVSWGDFNQDGLMDIYIGNMFSAAGNRVTYQRQFLDGRSPEHSSGIQRMARGNTLFMARPDGAFADVSEAAGVTMGRWAWSSKFADLNNDGREDLVVANGYFSNVKSDDL